MRKSRLIAAVLALISGLSVFASQANERPSSVFEEPPGPLTDFGNIHVYVDQGVKAPNASVITAFSWLAYARTLAGDCYGRVSPVVTEKDCSVFQFELHARDELADTWSSHRQKQSGDYLHDQYLDSLLKIKAAGYMAEYVWNYHWTYYWIKPEGLRIEEYKTWEAKNLPGFRPETHAGITVDAK